MIGSKVFVCISPLLEYAALVALCICAFLPEGNSHGLSPSFVYFLLYASMSLVFVIPLVSSILLLKIIIKEGLIQNNLLVLSFFSIVFLSCNLLAWTYAGCSWNASWQGWIFIYYIGVLNFLMLFGYCFWLEYQYNKQLEQPKRETK